MAIPGYMSCSLKVDTKAPEWHTTLIKVLKGVRGLSYDVDVAEGVARIYGKVDPKVLLKKLRKAGKKAELIEVHSDDDPYSYRNSDMNMMMYNYDHGYESYHDYPSCNYQNYGRVEPLPLHQYPYYPSNYHEPRYYRSRIEPSRYEPWAQHPYYLQYEPPAQFFPQPPSPMKIHPFYDPDYSCSIM
nr:heavy metal-associated isoprenylated plant protein 35 [Quercus suber]POF21869.1 heavy metal-associated isoprenylated plant protein 35 [Quercus suber]